MDTVTAIIVKNSRSFLMVYNLKLKLILLRCYHYFLIFYLLLHYLYYKKYSIAYLFDSKTKLDKNI